MLTKTLDSIGFVSQYDDEIAAAMGRELTRQQDGLELIEFLSLDCTAAEGEWHSDSEIKIDKLGYVIRNGQKTKTFWDGTIQSEKQAKRLKIRNICGDETVWTV